MREVAIIGVGMHRFGRFLNLSLKDLGRVAVWNAIHDAGIDPKLIEAAYVGNSLAGLITGQEGVRGQVILRDAGFTGIPVTNVEGACASSSIGLREAWIAIGAGIHDTALVLGVEKMFCEDTARSLSALAADSDMELLGGLGFQFVGNYAMRLRRYMEDYGWTQEHFAKVTVKNKYNGSLNPFAQYQKPMTMEEVLSSRLVAYPLTLYMCSSMADGAAAAILCAKETAHRYSSKPLPTIAACELYSLHFHDPRKEDDGELASYRIPIYRAYERSGVGPEDLDVVEVHDAMAPGEMIRCVACGLFTPEEAPRMIEEERTSLKGTIPVNPSGGLAARGHPVGATGLAMIAELVWQLRGEAGKRQVPGRKGKGPQIALAQNSGGLVAGEAAVSMGTILKL
ncbi:MAG: thiolase family protein [Deltaproteobacteria bacterium]|nr:thiolase family protein [Deltaproteobacteria bacterium]